MNERFNPLANIFDKPAKGSGLEQDFAALADGSLHTSHMFDEESSAHGGEAINPATGRPNVNKTEDELHGLGTRSVGGNDVMGDIPDPSSLSLEELMATQDEEE
jgi:hypothetical protein